MAVVPSRVSTAVVRSRVSTAVVRSRVSTAVVRSRVSTAVVRSRVSTAVVRSRARAMKNPVLNSSWARPSTRFGPALGWFSPTTRMPMLSLAQ